MQPTSRFTRTILAIALTTAFLLTTAPNASALDDAHRKKAEAAIANAFDYLRTEQNENGSWTPDPGPAVTALIAAAMLESPDIDRSDPTVNKALTYILSMRKPDGGIYDTILPNYNTSISLMALGRVRSSDSEIRQAVLNAQDFVRGLQWADGKTDPQGNPITPDHPWYGGAGYGGHGRPDLSNTATMIAGLNDSGLVCTDPAYQRALTFITMLQGTAANEKYGDKIVQDGGFIYATSEDKDTIGTLQSYATDRQPEDASTGTSRLRAYGTMTYAGFMSYLYAKLDRDDQRVQDAYNWLLNNYTLDNNPGTGMQGYFFYLYLQGRALHAWGDPVIEPKGKGEVDWANALIDKLTSLQKADGSFVNTDSGRWMESNPQLCTAYAALALQYALQ